MASEIDAVGTLTLRGTPLAELRVTDLKQELEKRGLSKSGSKIQLIERLKAQLLLEKLQQEAAQSSGDEHEGKVPNIALQQDNKAGQSEFVRQYLAQQQRNLEIQMGVKKQIEEQAKNRTESPKPEHGKMRPRSGSSVSSRSPSPDQSSQSSRSRPVQAMARKVERSRSSSSSSEEDIPRKKQRHRKRSSSHSRSRSPKAASPKINSPKSRRQSNTDHVKDVGLSRDGSGDKPAGKNESLEKVPATTGSRKKWRKKPSLAQAAGECADTNQRKESTVTNTTIMDTSDDSKRRHNSHEEETNNDNRTCEVSSDHEQDVRRVVTTTTITSTVTSDDPKGNNTQKPTDVGSATKDLTGKAKPLSQDKTRVIADEEAEKNVDKNSLRKETKGPQNSSARRQSRSSSSNSSSGDSRSRSPGHKRAGSRSSSSSSSGSDSHSSRSSSASSLAEDSPKKSHPGNRQAPAPIRKQSYSPGRAIQSVEMEVDSPKNKSPAAGNVDPDERPGRTSLQSTATASAAGEAKVKGQEVKRSQVDKEQENRPTEAEEKQEVAVSGSGDSNMRVESLDQAKDADDEAAAKKGIKKRKWNSKASKAAKTTKRTTSMEISSDVLKNLIGDVKLTETVFEMETEVNNTLDYDDQEEDQRDVKVKRTQSPNREEKPEEEADARRVETRDASPEPSEIPAEPEKKIIKLTSAAPKVGVKTKVKEGKKSKEHQEDSMGKEKKHVAVVDKETKEKVVATARAIKPLLTVVDEPEPVLSRQSPARNPPDRVIRIGGLVRPFTVNQLKELLRRTGELDEEYFWINDIKSHCMAAYKTQEQAVAARAALHGTRWPQSNPKILYVDFATIEDVIHRKQEGDAPMPAPTKRPPPDEQKKIKEPKIVEKEEKKHKTKETRERSRPEREKEERDTRERKREAEKKNVVREWDRDKVQQLSRSRSKSKERDRVARRSRSREREQRKRDHGKEKRDEDRRKDKKQKEVKAEEEPPAKLLDDLFRKTKATPCIYWLPLTEEQAQQRLAKRLEEEKERQKRIAAAEEREKEELKKRETARLERHRERDRAKEKSREKDRERNRQERSRSSRSSTRSRSHRRR